MDGIVLMTTAVAVVFGYMLSGQDITDASGWIVVALGVLVAAMSALIVAIDVSEVRERREAFDCGNFEWFLSLLPGRTHRLVRSVSSGVALGLVVILPAVSAWFVVPLVVVIVVDLWRVWSHGRMDRAGAREFGASGGAIAVVSVPSSSRCPEHASR